MNLTKTVEKNLILDLGQRQKGFWLYKTINQPVVDLAFEQNKRMIDGNRISSVLRAESTEEVQ